MFPFLLLGFPDRNFHGLIDSPSVPLNLRAFISCYKFQNCIVTTYSIKSFYRELKKRCFKVIFSKKDIGCGHLYVTLFSLLENSDILII